MFIFHSFIPSHLKYLPRKREAKNQARIIPGISWVDKRIYLPKKHNAFRVPTQHTHTLLLYERIQTFTSTEGVCLLNRAEHTYINKPSEIYWLVYVSYIHTLAKNRHRRENRRRRRLERGQDKTRRPAGLPSYTRSSLLLVCVYGQPLDATNRKRPESMADPVCSINPAVR